jgi:Predicted membrane protein
MGILAWIVVGLIAGWLASQVMRGGGYGLIGDIIVGIVGAVIGGFLAATLFHIPDAVNGINVTSILVAFVGAVILVGLLRLISPRRRAFWNR